LRVVLGEGRLADAQIEQVSVGGKGAVFCRVRYELDGESFRKRLVMPLDTGKGPGLLGLNFLTPSANAIYAVLFNRHRERIPIRVLAHPSRFGSVLLIEPFL